MTDAVATLVGVGCAVALALIGAIYKLGMELGKLRGDVDDCAGRLDDLEDWRSALRRGMPWAAREPRRGPAGGKESPSGR